jgi:hypothetical protein
MSFEIKTHKAKVPSKRAAKPAVTIDDGDEDDDSGFRLKPKKEPPKPEFLVSDEFGNFFCGYKDAYPYWSPKISEARELTEEAHFNTLVRWERNIRNLKKEYL